MTEVSEWGKGLPDYYSPVVTSRPQVLENVQVKWSQSTTYTVGAAAVAIDDFYTVASGYDLEIATGFISCKDSCINKLRIVAEDTEIIGDFRYDMQGSFDFAAGRVVDTGETITVYVYNNDTLTSKFSLTLIGILVKT